MNRWHRLILITITSVLPTGCQDAPGQASTQPASQPTTQLSGRSIPANWIATFEHEAIQEAIGVAIIDDGVAVSDPKAGVIHLFNLTGQRVGVWSPGNGSIPLGRPMHVAADQKGRLYVADYLSDQVLLLARDGSLVLSFGEHGSQPGQFDAPAGVAVADDGSIYVADFNNHRVQRFDATGGFERSWGQEGHEPGQLYYPTDVALGAEGRVYIADAYNHRIQVFTQDGDYITAWGRQGNAAGEFDVAIGIGIDGKGRVYVADQFNHRVQVFSSRGEFLGGWGQPGAGPGQFDRPSEVAFDEAGRAYVADFGNARVQVFTLQQGTEGVREESSTWADIQPTRSSLGRYWY